MNRRSITIPFCVILFIISGIFDIYLFISLFLNPANSSLIAPVSILTSIIIASASPLYKYIFKRPKLVLDLENSRNILIDIFDTESSSLIEKKEKGLSMNIVTTDDDFETKEKSKYIRINLINKGKKTAENCSIKLHIYYEDGILAYEPSKLYPAGYHHAKLKKNLPPLIDIAAGDSQIFDVCSTNNRFGNDRLLRFEDHFTHTRIQARNRPLFIRTYYIKLFVYSDNNSPIEKQYKIYKDSSLKGLDWQKINIKEYKWEKTKKNEARRQRISKWKSKWKSRLKNNRTFLI